MNWKETQKDVFEAKGYRIEKQGDIFILYTKDGKYKHNSLDNAMMHAHKLRTKARNELKKKFRVISSH